MSNRGLKSIGINKIIPAQIDFTQVVSGSAAGEGSIIALSSTGTPVLINPLMFLDAGSNAQYSGGGGLGVFTRFVSTDANYTTSDFNKKNVILIEKRGGVNDADSGQMQKVTIEHLAYGMADGSTITATNGVLSAAGATGDITGVTAGNGLTGGGDTGAVTLTVGEGTGITVASTTVSTNDSEIVHDNLSGFVSNEHIDHSGVSITAGDGLTGGGTIAATRTLAVGAGTGIDVAANSISVDVSDFMANGSNNRVVTATGADAQNAEANLTFNGLQLDIAGSVKATSYIWSQVTSDVTFGSFYADNLSTHADAATAMYFRLDNSTSTQKIAAIITVGKVQDWDSSANTDGYISFTTRVNDASSEAMRIQNNNVGIGETAPTKTLTVRTADTNTTVASGKGLPGAAAGAGVLIHNESSTANTYANLDFRAGSADARIALQFKSLNNGDMHFVMDNSGTSTSQMIISNEGELFAPNLDAITGDYYLRYETDDGEIGYYTSKRVTKKNIESISSSRAIEIVNSLNPVNFEYKSEKMTGLKFGFIAEEVADVETNLSSYHADYQYNEETGKIERDEETGEKIIKSDARVPCMWSMEGVISVLVKVAQEQQKEIEDLKEQVKSLQ